MDENVAQSDHSDQGAGGPQSVRRALHVRRALREELPHWGVLVLESHHASDFTMQWRTHRFAKIVYFLDGSGQFDVGERCFDFEKGDVVVVAPGDRNRIRDGESSPSTLYAGCISESILTCEPVFAKTLATHKIPGPGRTSGLVAAQLRKLLFLQENPSNLVSLEMLSGAWRLMRAVHEHSLHPRLINAPSTKASPANLMNEDLETVQHYVRQLAESFIEARSIDQAAADCGLPRRRFTTLFREVTGMTWLTYVRQLAIEHSEHLLRETDLPVVSIAFESGFADVSTFYRQFNKQTGFSPAAYRRQCRTK